MKDHLGNTRMVLTTEQQTDLYAATQEPANATKENLLFNNLSSTTITKPGGFDSDNTNTKVSKVNGGSASTRIGPSIILKVMAGDIVSISTKAWYTGATQAPTTGLGPIKDQLLTLLTNGIAANNGIQHGAIPLSDISGGAGTVLTDFLSNSQPYNSSRPKAFLNWIIVDEEFKKVNSSFHMGAVQIPLITGAMQKQQLTGPANMTVRRNGWLYVYVSNESNQDVFFDDLIINDQRGPVVEMNNYYPFGLEIPGLASRAIGFGGSNENRYKYNGKELQSKEFSDGSGLTWDDYGARMYDPQIARWQVQDPKFQKYDMLSPYSYALNNPIVYKDPDGKDARIAIDKNNHSISLSSTIYITGENSGKIFASVLNYLSKSYVQDELSNGKYTDEDGTEWNMSINLDFKLLPDDKKPQDIDGTGDNLIDSKDRGNGMFSFTKSPGRPDERVGARNEFKDGKPVLIPGFFKSKDRVGFETLWNTQDFINGNSDYTGNTAIHEVFHLFGLGDRYKQSFVNGKRVTVGDKGWDGDIMNGGYKISQTHWDDWGKKILELFKVKGSNNFILDSKVDNANN